MLFLPKPIEESIGKKIKNGKKKNTDMSIKIKRDTYWTVAIGTIDITPDTVMLCKFFPGVIAP
jgi:hypothetical protein